MDSCLKFLGLVRLLITVLMTVSSLNLKILQFVDDKIFSFFELLNLSILGLLDCLNKSIFKFIYALPQGIKVVID